MMEKSLLQNREALVGNPTPGQTLRVQPWRKHGVLRMAFSSANKGAGLVALYSLPHRHLSYEIGRGGSPRLKIREILAV